MTTLKLIVAFTLLPLISECVGKIRDKCDSTLLDTVLDENSPDYWTHKEQNQWGDRWPTCNGQHQSPINLSGNNAKTICAKCLTWTNYNNKNKYLTLENTGHSIEASTSSKEGGPAILQGGNLKGKYRFVSMHWHWGDNENRGSEHTFDGRNYSMEMHAIHLSERYSSLSEALTSRDPEALVVVAIPIRETLYSSNPGTSAITRSLRCAKAPGPQPPTPLPLGQLGFNFKDGYFTYVGSLTTPPCYQTVRWIVRDKVLTLKHTELSTFRRVSVNGKPLLDNFRHVQKLNERKLEYVKSCNCAGN